jgi:predicted amidohydrolase
VTETETETAIGIAQWHAVCGEPATNLDDALGHIHALASLGAQWIVLPELWPSGYDPATLADDAAAAAEPLAGPRGKALSEAARATGSWLFAGTVPELEGGALYNTAVVYAPDGTIRAAHRKHHLYSPLDEHLVFSAGTDATVFNLDGVGTVGISTCFDGDHPAYARRLHDLGARIVVAPCAYEDAAESWWDLLYPANALANGQWWLMANQSGGGMFGGSRLIAPDGSIRAEAPRWKDEAEPATLVVRVDLAAEIARADADAAALWQ